MGKIDKEKTRAPRYRIRSVHPDLVVACQSCGVDTPYEVHCGMVVSTYCAGCLRAMAAMATAIEAGEIKAEPGWGTD